MIINETARHSIGTTLKVLPNALKAEDGDKAINAPILYSFDSANSKQFAKLRIDEFLHLNSISGELRLIGELPSDLLASNSDNGFTLVIRATQADNKDRYTLTTLTLTNALPSRPTLSPLSSSSTSSSSSLSSSSLASSFSSALFSNFANTQSSNNLISKKNGLSFDSSAQIVQVFEDLSIGTRILRVRARHLNSSSNSAQFDESVDLINSQQTNKPQINNNNNISYQILDDSNEQLFAISENGEIFLKRLLDFETRQEHKFRILATHGKNSDICHVTVKVKNVNDNKPKVSSKTQKKNEKELFVAKE